LIPALGALVGASVTFCTLLHPELHLRVGIALCETKVYSRLGITSGRTVPEQYYGSASAPASQEDVIAQLERLGALRAQGILTEGVRCRQEETPGYLTAGLLTRARTLSGC